MLDHPLPKEFNSPPWKRGGVRLGIFLAIIPLLLAFTLGLWRLEVESIWHDEAWSIRAIDSPFGTPDDNTPPVYYMTLHLLQRLGVGHSPFALRYGSVLINLLTVAIAIRLGWQWYNLRLGLLGGCLLALSPLLWEYSQEVRAYVAVPFFALLFLWGADQILKVAPPLYKGKEAEDGVKERTQYIVSLHLAELIGLYTHNLVVLLVVWLNVVVIGFWVWGKIRKSSYTIYRVPTWILGQVAVFILYIPWLTSQSPSGTPLNTVPEFGRKLSQDLWRGYIFPVISDPDDLPRRFLTLVHLLPLLAGISLVILAWRGRNRRSLLIFSQVILLPIFSTLLLQRAHIDFHPRYYILAVPSTLLLLVAAVGSLPRELQSVGGGIVLGVSALITQYSLNYIAAHPEYQHDDFRGMAAYYASLPADTVILIPFDDEPALQYYYAREMNIQAEFVNIPLYSKQASLETLLQQNFAHIELLTWFQVPADERGMYPCLLTAASEELDEPYQTYGLQTQGYYLEQEESARIFGSVPNPEIHFKADIQPTSLLYTGSPQGQCISSAWFLPVSTESHPEMPIVPTTEFRVSTQLISPLGREMTRAEAVILNHEQTPIGWNEVIGNGVGQAYNLLQLPEGLPAGNYAVHLQLYTPQNLTGFDVLNPTTNQSLGKTWRLNTVPFAGRPFENPPKEASLTHDNSVNKSLQSGQVLEIEFISPYEEREIPIRLVGQDWQLEDTISVKNPSLVWHTFKISPDASGEATLYFNEVELATYTIIPTERIWERPPTQIETEFVFPDLAQIIGANITQTEEELTAEIVWQPLATPETDYMVFVQVLNESGQLLVQSDSEPMYGQRPTSSWIPDEYLRDSHTLKLNDVDYSGQATLIVGLYDPLSRERVRLANGQEYATLPIDITIR